MSDNINRRLAVLIDADNAQPTIIEDLLSEIAKYGTANVKRAYGDWTRPNLKTWKVNLHKYAIQPIQQFSYSVGKNSTDSALIIDAMDLLYTNNFDGFCIVSSDSDFTRLATRIREAGLFVLGFGEKIKAQNPFIVACDKFIFTEILKHGKEDDKDSNIAVNREGIKPIEDILKPAVRAMSKDDGWAALGTVGVFISKNEPSFDARNYGFEKLGALVRKLDFFKNKRGSI